MLKSLFFIVYSLSKPENIYVWPLETHMTKQEVSLADEDSGVDSGP